MPQIDPKQLPSYETADYREMSAAWTIVRDVSGGTARMREAGETYLPKGPGELDAHYQRRLNPSVLFNAYKRTRGGLTGMVTKLPPVIKDDVPAAIKLHLENIDLAGTHLDVFIKELFEDAFEGHAFILVDMEQALPPGASRADEQAAGLRPYWLRYKADQAVNWRTSRINGEEHLTQITFRERSNEADGAYGETQVTRYRVFRKVDGVVEWELYRIVKEEGSEAQLVSDGAGTTTLDRIPVAIVYGKRLGLMKSEPPLLDLAYLNIAHWQEYSDYRNALHIAEVPMLKRIGADKEQKHAEPGAGAILDVPIGGDVGWIEIQGAGIAAGRTELVDLEQRMAMMGLSLLTQRSDSNITATEKKIDNNERQSELSSMARSLKDCVEDAMQLHAQYLGAEDGGSIELGVDEEELVLRNDTASITNQSDKVENLGLSKRQALRELGYSEKEITDIFAEKKLENEEDGATEDRDFNAG